MCTRPAVSVIIPAYNGEEFLRPCLDSVFAQTLKPLQVICVNDGSTDHTAQILAAYQRLHPDMIIITQDNCGLSAARNAGLACATGEYIDFLDCDDTLQADALERLYRRASRDSLDMLFYDGETVYATETLRLAYPGYENLYRTKVNIVKTPMTGQKLFVQLVEGKSYRSSACMYLLRLDFLKAQGFAFLPGVYYEDNVFTLQCLLCADRASLDPTPYYKRNMHDSSIVTVRKSFLHARSYYICQNALQSFLLAHAFSASVMRCAQQQVASLMQNAVQVYDQLTEAERKEALAQYPDAILMDETLRMRDIFPKAVPAPIQDEPFIPPVWMKDTTLRKYTAQDYLPESPFVSVIIPVYNAAEHLQETIHDLQQQTLKNFEMLFVDDGSSDNSCEILESYAARDGRIHILRQKNQYAGVARNTGMARAKGEYMIFLDADDRFRPELLIYAYACAKANDAQIVLFHADLLQMPEESYTPAAFLCPCKRLPKQVFSGLEGREHIFDVLNPWTKLFSRRYIQQLGITFQPLFSSNDLYFSMVAMASAERIAPLPVVLVHYRVGQSNNIQSKKSKAPLDTYHAFAAVKAEMEARGIFEPFQKAFAVKAAESMLRSLDTMTTLDGYRQLYQTLHEGGLDNLEVASVDSVDMKQSNGAHRLERCKSIMSMDFDTYMLHALTSPAVSPSSARVSQAYAEEIARLRDDMQALRNSYAYRIGSKLTLPFHVIKVSIQKILRQNSLLE